MLYRLKILNAQKELIAKRKLNRILRSKAVTPPTITVGDVVQVYLKSENAKRGSWSAPKTVVNFDPESGIVTLPGKNGKLLRPAIEDVRYAVASPFAADVQRANDELDDQIDDALDLTAQKGSDINVDKSSTEHNGKYLIVDTEYTGKNDQCPAVADQTAFEPEGLAPRDIDKTEFSESDTDNTSHVDGGESFGAPNLSEELEQGEEFGPWNVEYWNGARNSNANLDTVTPGTALTSLEKETLQMYYNRFGTKEFTRKQAEASCVAP